MTTAFTAFTTGTTALVSDRRVLLVLGVLLALILALGAPGEADARPKGPG